MDFFMSPAQQNDLGTDSTTSCSSKARGFQGTMTVVDHSRDCGIHTWKDDSFLFMDRSLRISIPRKSCFVGHEREYSVWITQSAYRLCHNK